MDIRAKYIKVKALADRGATEGERAAAKAALERMEEAHPELKPGNGGRVPLVRWPVRVVYQYGFCDSSTSSVSDVSANFNFNRYWT